MSYAVGPGDLVLCVNAAPNHVTGQPVPLVAGETYTVTMQSRNGLGDDHDLDNDTYTVVFADSGGANTLQTTATYQVGDNGLYSASVQPTIAASYTVTID